MDENALMKTNDWTLRALLSIIALFVGMIALRPYFEPGTSVLAQSHKFDHVELVSTAFLYKGRQALLVWDRRNANVWVIPRNNDDFEAPVFLLRVPLEKLDQPPH